MKGIMKRNNRGAALAYSLMLTMIVFSICALILTIMLSQINSSNVNAQRAELESAYMHIGELFLEAEGDKSNFDELLEKEGFEKENESEEERISKGKLNFKLKYVEDTDIKTLMIMSTSETLYLTVGIKDGKLVKWSKEGKEERENDKTEEAE